MPSEMMRTPDSGEGKENLDLDRIETIRKQLEANFQSISRELDSIKVMAEIAKERGFTLSEGAQAKAEEILQRFEIGGGEYVRTLYKMISDLGSIPTAGFTEGLKITQEEFNTKLAEIRAREAEQKS